MNHRPFSQVKGSTSDCFATWTPLRNCLIWTQSEKWQELWVFSGFLFVLAPVLTSLVVKEAMNLYYNKKISGWIISIYFTQNFQGSNGNCKKCILPIIYGTLIKSFLTRIQDFGKGSSLLASSIVFFVLIGICYLLTCFARRSRNVTVNNDSDSDLIFPL